MEKFQRISALIAILPTTPEKKFRYLYRMVAVIHNSRLLNFVIEEINNEINKEFYLGSDNDKLARNENSKIEDIRSKLLQISNMK